MRVLFLAVATSLPNDWEMAKAGKEMPGEHDMDMVNQRIKAMTQQIKNDQQQFVKENPGVQRIENSDGFKNFIKDSTLGGGPAFPSLLENGDVPMSQQGKRSKPLTADQERAQDLAEFAKVSKDLHTVTDFIEAGGAKIKADSDYFAKERKEQVEAQDRRIHPSKYASGPMSSFAQTSENPDDGFAKVEAKLKALQEKIKADTAKFEQEAKAAPSSFIQTSENPDDGFAKVEAKLKALQEKIKADTAKFEKQAAPPSSLIQAAQILEVDPNDANYLHLQDKLQKMSEQVKADTARFAEAANIPVPAAPMSFADLGLGEDPTNEEIMDRVAVLSGKMDAVRKKFEQEADKDNAAAHSADAMSSSLVEENMRKAK